MGSINKEISRYEATAVYTHPDAKVDIILVHGLNGDPQRTWTAKTNGTFWPTDLLPETLKDARANVLVYGYNADVYSKKHGTNPSDNFIYQHAQTLVTSLTHFRKDELSSRNPIIWVCHSLGGILTKRALLYSNDLKSAQHEEYRSLYVSTYGMVFLGTPHAGSAIAGWGTIVQAMSDAVVPKSFFHSEPVLLRTLKKDNETLQNINNHFLDIYQRFKIIMAHECHKTDLKTTRMLIVDQASAGPQLPGVLYFGIEATHSNMCKFESKNAPGFRTMVSPMRDWVLDAPSVITTRWRVEDEERLIRAQQEIGDRMHVWGQSQQLVQNEIMYRHTENTNMPVNFPKIDERPKAIMPAPQKAQTIAETSPPEEVELPSQTTQTTSLGDQTSSKGPISVKPTSFRPNSHFKGREQELKTLHKMLMDRSRRATGTASVLVQSMPGGGKSQLARQYVFKQKHHYPGGIFWIRAKSLEELEEGFRDIAKAAHLAVAEDLKPHRTDDTLKMVQAVRKWLNRTDNWLLVFDGIHFDMPNLHLFIPFAKNTSIIYTSTERAIADDYLFDSPKVIALDRISIKDARDLLLEEMGKTEPYNSDDVSRATELVNLMDRLPLMIHVAANHLKATKEPLATYLRSFRNRPKTGPLQAYLEVRNQLQDRGFTAALNLMCILAFYDQHVPVELLVLGIKELDRSTPVKSLNSSRDRLSLNHSFQILISFALIDRNICDESISASSGSNKSVDMDRENLDVLHIHGIVQAFFVDMLADEKEAPFWLQQSIRVFSRAFDDAEYLASKNKYTGVPEDFRRFRIHGRRILSHLDRFERRSIELAPWRKSVTSRMELIDGLIEELSQRADDVETGKGGNSVFSSVFERAGSVSEHDSETPASIIGMNDYFDGEGEQLTIPAPLVSPTDHNPYHWHVSYPRREDFDIYDEETLSQAATPRPPEAGGVQSVRMPDDQEIIRKLAENEHRTIRRQSQKRYRNQVGAWQSTQQVASDPRVSLSRETAKAILKSQDPKYNTTGRDDYLKAGLEVLTTGLAELTSNLHGDNVRSEAAHSLDHIKQGSISLPHSSSVLSLNPKSKALARPALVGGRPSWSHARVASTNDASSVMPTFSYRRDGYSAPSSSYTAATLMRLRETDGRVMLEEISPVDLSSPLSASPGSPVPRLERDGQGGSVDHIVLARSISIVDPEAPKTYSGPLSTRSSPTHPTGSFPPSSGSSSPRTDQFKQPDNFVLSSPSSPIDIPRRTRERSLSPGRSQDRAYEPHADSVLFANDGGRKNANLGAHSVPLLQTGTQKLGNRVSSPLSRSPVNATMTELLLPTSASLPTHPAPWTSETSHYQAVDNPSQPMSRQASRQSARTHFSDNSLPLLPENKQGLLPIYGDQWTRHGSSQSSPGPQSMQWPRSRRPSVVETEPSPSIPSFDIEPQVESSEDFHQQADPNKSFLDMRSKPWVSGVPPPAPRPLPYPDERRPASTASQDLYSRLRGGKNGRPSGFSEETESQTNQRRSASANGRLTGLMRGRQSSRPGPNRENASRADESLPGTTSLSSGSLQIPQVTPTSPGIRLNDGSIVEFGGGYGRPDPRSQPRLFRRTSWRKFRGRRDKAVLGQSSGSEASDLPGVGLGIQQGNEAME